MLAHNKPERHSSFNKVEIARIVTSMSDMTLASVSYGKYATRVPDGVAYGIYEWFKYLLLIEFEVRTVKYGPSFVPVDLWPKREARGP